MLNCFSHLRSKIENHMPQMLLKESDINNFNFPVNMSLQFNIISPFFYCFCFGVLVLVVFFFFGGGGGGGGLGGRI